MSAIDELPFCRRCGGRVAGTGVKKTFLATGECYHFHRICWDCILQFSEERSQRAADAERFALRQLSHLRTALPARTWRSTIPDLLALIRSRRLRRLVTDWTPGRGSLLLLGASGLGKTTTAATIVRRLADAAVESCKRAAAYQRAELTLAAGILWLVGAELVVARREHSLGAGEAPLVSRAKSATLCILDEVGHESITADPIVCELIETREAADAPTIVTSGLSRRDFALRYGDSTLRRLTERGTLIEGADSQ